MGKDKATATICIDFKNTSLKEFKDNLIMKELSLQQPDVRVGESCVLIDADDDEPDANFLKKKLADFEAIKSGCIMVIEDWLQDIELQLTLVEKTENDDFEENFKIIDSKKAKVT